MDHETPRADESAAAAEIGLEDLRNLVVEAANARDPQLVELAGLADVATLRRTLQTIDERWPRLMMTRGDIGETPVAVVWMPDAHERYRPVAHLEVSVVPGGTGHLTLVDGLSPDLVAEEPPGLRVAEWESATAFDRGEDRWV